MSLRCNDCHHSIKHHDSTGCDVMGCGCLLTMAQVTLRQ